MVENHAYFLDVRDSKKISKLNQLLLGILEETQNKQEDEILFPSSDFTALFFITHAIKHLSEDALPLRTYCDWALFLQAHAGELDSNKWREALQDAGVLDIAEALTTLAFRWLEIPPTVFPVKRHIERENQLFKEMIEPLYLPCQETNPWKVFIYKSKRFRDKYKRHKSFYGGNILATLSSSFVYHIHHPKMIFKIH